MRPSKLRRRLLPVSAAVLIASGLLISVIPATAATSASATAKASNDDECIQLNLIDSIVKYYANMDVSPTAPPVGYMTIWFAHLQSSTGSDLAGNGVGNLDIISNDPSTGASIAYLTELVQFPNGALRYSGSYNRTDALEQKWMTGHVLGISGDYLGMSGTMNWRILSLSDPTIPTEEDIVLCPDDDSQGS